MSDFMIEDLNDQLAEAENRLDSLQTTYTAAIKELLEALENRATDEKSKEEFLYLKNRLRLTYGIIL